LIDEIFMKQLEVVMADKDGTTVVTVGGAVVGAIIGAIFFGVAGAIVGGIIGGGLTGGVVINS
jgi:hypothetical protein